MECKRQWDYFDQSGRLGLQVRGRASSGMGTRNVSIGPLCFLFLDTNPGFHGKRTTSQVRVQCEETCGANKDKTYQVNKIDQSNMHFWNRGYFSRGDKHE